MGIGNSAKDIFGYAHYMAMPWNTIRRVGFLGAILYNCGTRKRSQGGNLSQLSQSKILPYGENTTALSSDEMQPLLAQIPRWTVSEVDGVKQLQRAYKFPDFSRALDFTQQVGREADAANHHPAILTEWGKVTVTWTTHKVHGLHQNDFVMAAKTDEAFERVQQA
jgi:4a-hydroxytetrahydrobiopterin dehydratase